MWKCFTRGVLSSANVLKADQSNGVCVISSLVNKDIDELTCQLNNRNECTYCSYENAKSNEQIRKYGTRYKQESHSERVNDNGKDSNAEIYKNFSQVQGVNQSEGTVFQSTVTKGKDLTKFEKRGFIKHHPEVISGNERLHSCQIVNESARDDVKPYTSSWFSKNRNLRIRVENGPPVFVPGNVVLKNTNLKSLTSECNSLSTNLQEKDCNDTSARNLDSTSSSKYSHLSFFNSNTSCNIGENPTSSKNNEILFNGKGQSRDRSSYCLLKLPFLNSNIVNLKGLNRLTCWVKNSSEFGGDGNKNRGKSRKGENEEAKEEPWRRFHMHQSLLEAIGWSSAILLGWFLAQCRIWHLYERRNAERKKNGERRNCIGGMANRLVSSLRAYNISSQKSYPSDTSNMVRKKKLKKMPDIRTNEDKGLFESGKVFRVNDLKKSTHLRNQNHSLLYEGSRASIKASKNPGNVLSGQNSSFVDGKEKTVIPLPWYENSEQIPYGPMTFEEAVNEAGKGLEEAQAEVLLQLALEKLDVAENFTSPEPSAVELLESSARLGNAAAAFNLGICYEMGVGGVGKDLLNAYYWYKNASDAGHAAATYNIAIFHAQGLAGLEQNELLAYKLLEKASSLGQTEATDALALLTSLKLTSSGDTVKPYQEAGYVLDQEDKRYNNDLIANESQMVPNHFYSSPKMELSSVGFSKDVTFNLDNLMDSFSLTFCNIEESIANELLELTQNVKRT